MKKLILSILIILITNVSYSQSDADIYYLKVYPIEEVTNNEEGKYDNGTVFELFLNSPKIYLSEKCFINFHLADINDKKISEDNAVRIYGISYNYLLDETSSFNYEGVEELYPECSDEDLQFLKEYGVKGYIVFEINALNLPNIRITVGYFGDKLDLVLRDFEVWLY